MKFGKLNDIESIDFSLPEDHIGTSQLFEKLSKSNKDPKIYIGTTGWSNKEWKGIYYPQKAASSTYLSHYAGLLNSIELNTTHYRIPSFDHVLDWKKKVNESFKFCPKIPQSISHRGSLRTKKELLQNFYDVIQKLEGNLGICFMQLPDYFGVENLGNLKHFLVNLPSRIPFAVEIRNKNWFSNEKEQTDLFQFFELHHITTVITDVAGRRDVLHQRLCTDKLIIRFVGNSLHNTDYQRLDQWIIKLEQWIKQGLNEVHFFFHQPSMKLVPDTINYFANQSNLRGNLPKIHLMDKINSQNTQLELF